MTDNNAMKRNPLVPKTTLATTLAAALLLGLFVNFVHGGEAHALEPNESTPAPALAVPVDTESIR